MSNKCLDIGSMRNVCSPETVIFGQPQCQCECVQDGYFDDIFDPDPPPPITAVGQFGKWLSNFWNGSPEDILIRKYAARNPDQSPLPEHHAKELIRLLREECGEDLASKILAELAIFFIGGYKQLMKDLGDANNGAMRGIDKIHKRDQLMHNFRKSIRDKCQNGNGGPRRAAQPNSIPVAHDVSHSIAFDFTFSPTPKALPIAIPWYISVAEFFKGALITAEGFFVIVPVPRMFLDRNNSSTTST